MRGIRKRSAALVAVAAASCLGFVGSGTTPAGVTPPLPQQHVFDLIDRDADRPRFDGTIHGWRVAPYAALQAEGIPTTGASSVLGDCDPKPGVVEPHARLEIDPALLPAGVRLTGDSGALAWWCGSRVVGVARSFQLDSPYGAGFLHVARTPMAARVLELDAAADRVEEGWVSGSPAVVVHMADDATGLGLGEIVVIEDDVLDPLATVLHLQADGVPLAALRSIAERQL